jgi:5-methylcytosine-specific restriction protein A
VKAEQVHHIKPLSEGGSHNDENLMSLCTACHAKIHADRGDRWHTHSDR